MITIRFSKGDSTAVASLKVRPGGSVECVVWSGDESLWSEIERTRPALGDYPLQEDWMVLTTAAASRVGIAWRIDPSHEPAHEFDQVLP